MVKGWIRMTKVARLFEEEKIEAVNKTRMETQANIALNMIRLGFDRLKVMECTGLTREEINKLQQSLI